MPTGFVVLVTGLNYRRSIRSEKETPLSAAVDAFVECGIGDPMIVDVSTVRDIGGDLPNRVIVKIRSSRDEEFLVHVRDEID
jgi:hypothetical protein